MGVSSSNGDYPRQALKEKIVQQVGYSIFWWPGAE